ncbi:type IV secretion system protein [Pseudophaeobacter sp.]|uniref:type IV secretion system protein n=1 Tax=Pseudophaeobacter sp. TaxID=1971739 RepID=UPI004058C918
MGVISDILSVVDDAVAGVAQEGFVEIAGTVGGVISAGSALLVVLLGINIVVQIRPMSFGSFFAFGIKIALVGIFAQSWPNFQVVYTIITQVPDSIGSAIISLTGVTSTGGLYDALDSMVSQVTEYGDTIGDSAGWVFGAVLGVVVWVIAAIFAAVSAGIIAYAKIILTLMVVVAPVAILCSLFKPTMSIFEAWSRSIIGYAFMPIAAAGAAGIVIAIAGEIASTTPDPDGVDTLNLIFPFIVVLFLAAGIMLAVPSIAMGLSGTIGIASNAADLSGLAKRGVVRSGQIGRRAMGETGSFVSKAIVTTQARTNAPASNATSSPPPRSSPAARLAQTQSLRPNK